MVVKRKRTSPLRLSAKIDQGITAKICDEENGLDFELQFGEHDIKIQRKNKIDFMHNSVPHFRISIFMWFLL